MTASVYGLAIDTDAADIQPPGATAQAGSTGKVADAGHVHPLTIEDIWPATTLGDLVYGGASGAATRLGGNTAAARKFLRQLGTGSVSAAPAWDELELSDLPAGSMSAWINVTEAAYGADPTGASDSTHAINTALTAAAPFGLLVYAPAGTYKTTAPLLPPPGVTLHGDFANEVATYLDALWGTIIQPASTWSAGASAWNGIISVLDQTTGGYSVTSEEQKIIGLMVDCHLLTTGTADGIQLYGGVSRTRIEDVLVAHAPNCCYNMVNADGTQPGHYRLKRANARYAGNVSGAPQGYGYWLNKTSDATAEDCISENSASDGWNVVNCHNGTFLGCRSEHSGGNGWTYTCNNSAVGSGGVRFVGCSTDRSNKHGMEITSTNGSGVPIQLSGCTFRRDGSNSSVGGGGYAGLYVHGFPGSVLFGGGSAVFPGLNDDGTGVNSPQIGVLLASNNNSSPPNTYIAFGTSHIQGATTGISDDGSAQEVRYSPACIQATGTTGSPQILGPREGFATLVSGTVTVPTTLIGSNSRILHSYAKVSGTPGFLDTDSRTAGTSFVITSRTSTGTLNTADNSGVYWWIANP